MHCHFHNPVSIHSGPGMRRQNQGAGRRNTGKRRSSSPPAARAPGRSPKKQALRWKPPGSAGRTTTASVPTRWAP